MADIKKIKVGNTTYDIVDANALHKIVETTWSALKTLRDNSQLAKGQQYRITDYNCTTTQFDTQSAGHQFDIIVIADDVNKLNENARAIKHSGDTYFTNAGSKLESWELKYCLDNDTSRFAWANTSTGKGVIYWMKDEFNNECPYDFKNIQFKRYKVTPTQEYSTILSDLNNKYLGFIGEMQGLTIPSETDFIWCYTFSAWDEGENANTQKDATLLNNEELPEIGWYNGQQSKCKENKIAPLTTVVSSEEETGLPKLALNNIVIKSELSNNYESYNNTFELNCGNTTIESGDANCFKVNCHNNILYYSYKNTFGDDCRSNTFGDDCYGNTFENNCGSNTFGNSCGSNTFGNYCDSNTFGNGCYGNTFGDDCGSNTFGNYCDSNTFENSCDSNTFGDDCGYNTFGDDCYGNTFENNCRSNTFGDDCYDNTFGNYCNGNTFGDSCSSNTLVASGNINYAQYNIFENGVDYVDLQASTSGSSSSYLQNIKIRQGVKGTSSTHKVITETRNLTHDVTYRAIGAEDKAI